MKTSRLLRVTDRIAIWTFVRVLNYWKWRTGRPALVAVMSPELAREHVRVEYPQGEKFH